MSALVHPTRRPFVRDTAYLDGLGPPPYAFFDEVQDELSAAFGAGVGLGYFLSSEDFTEAAFPANKLGTLDVYQNLPFGGGLGLQPVGATDPGEHGVWGGFSNTNPFYLELRGAELFLPGDFLVSARVKLINRATLDPLVNGGFVVGLGGVGSGLPCFVAGGDALTWHVIPSGIAPVDTGVTIADQRWHCLQICRLRGGLRFLINGYPVPLSEGVDAPDPLVCRKYLQARRWNPGPNLEGFYIDFFHLFGVR